MKAKYIIKKDDGDYRMSPNLNGENKDPVFGKGQILADFINRLLNTLEHMSDGDTITMEFEAKIK